MKQPSFDPGLTQQYDAELRRSINPDGSFNVHRRGVRDSDVYKSLIGTTWPKFAFFVIGGFLLVNLIFATVYISIGIDHLKGAKFDSVENEFLSAFFFSVHTLTTVGYGNIYPDGVAANSVAALEAMCGLMGFALATGLLYGRFSRPSAKILFSKSMVIAPYQDGTALMFRIANRRTNILMEIEATVMLMTVQKNAAQFKREYAVLNLERRKVFFLPLTWTVVHPIDETSPLYGKTAEDLKSDQAEFLILVKAFDDTFSQTVHARYSYPQDEVEWGAKFAPAFDIEKGDMVLDLERVSATSPAQPGAAIR